MKSLHDIESSNTRERAVLAAVIPTRASRGEHDENLLELERLADTAGADTVAIVTQEREHPNAVTYLGKGKANELAALVAEHNASLVIFDDDLSPNQGRNLEELCKCKILDRSGLILDIFARHAHTREAQTQVELAQLEYLLPRLTRMWTHLSKQHGGIGTKGPGETQLETDRRIIQTRITKLKQKLDEIDRQRTTQRQLRKRLPRVALVGYTNAGKSTLFHALTRADVLIEDRLFATLDATTRPMKANGIEFLVTDTVGFIRKLPTHLVASFRSTLAEVSEADVIAHVVDASHPNFADQVEVVNATLAELGAGQKPTLTVFNKIDAMQEELDRAEVENRNDRSEAAAIMAMTARNYPQSVMVSALKEINLTGLLESLTAIITRNYIEREIILPPGDARTAARLYEYTTVISHVSTEEKQILTLRYPAQISPVVDRIVEEGEVIQIDSLHEAR